jgi:hypothetical protein
VIRSAIRRTTLFACGILGIAAAAAAMRGNSWSPLDAFLDHGTAPESQQALLNTDLSPNGSSGSLRTSFGSAYRPSAIGPGVTGMSIGGFSHDADKSNEGGWSSSRMAGAFAASHDGPSASAGNLWRLLGLTHGQAATTQTASTHTSTPHQTAPKPAAPHTTAPHSSNGGSQGGGSPANVINVVNSPSASVTANATFVTAPVILIGNNATQVSNLIGGGNSGSQGSGGSFVQGGTLPPVHRGGGQGGGQGGGGGLSATPEPASIFLIGTGLFGLAAIVRRKRA